MNGIGFITISAFRATAVLLAISTLFWTSSGEAQEGLNLDQGKRLVLERDMRRCRLPEGKMEEKTVIYTVFLSQGYGGPGTPPDPKFFLTNNALAKKLQERCPGVEFLVQDITQPSNMPSSLFEDLKKRQPWAI